jgi:tetratricopeptide (TPR) repeat protein
MSVLRWIGGVLGLAVLIALADGAALRLWSMPPLPVMVKPVAPDSQLGRLMSAARSASRASDHTQAIGLYTQALAIEPGPNVISQSLRALRGSEYNHIGDDAKAFADFDAAIRIGYPEKPLSGNAIRAYMGRGYASVNLGQYAPAKDDFDKVLHEIPNERPRSSSTLAWRGAAYQGLGDRERATTDYKAALAIDPDNAYARNALNDLERP